MNKNNAKEHTETIYMALSMAPKNKSGLWEGNQ